jgi:hypothetical protein
MSGRPSTLRCMLLYGSQTDVHSLRSLCHESWHMPALDKMEGGSTVVGVPLSAQAAEKRTEICDSIPDDLLYTNSDSKLTCFTSAHR